MLEELAVHQHLVAVPPIVLPRNVVVPEAVLVVVVLHWLLEIDLLLHSLHLVDLCIRLAVKVRHALLNLRLDLELTDVHL